MLTYLINGIAHGNVDFMTIFIDILASLVVIFLIMPFHEWAHAFVAYKLGDTSVKYRGRLTLNPIEHIDPIGALLIIFFGFGWAKPVPIDDRNFKNPKVGMGITALAGPVANFIAALAGGFIYCALCRFLPDFMFSSQAGDYVSLFFSYYIYLNVILAVFNLVPIPPLDGSKILFMLLPDRVVNVIYKYERFFFIAIIILLWFNILPIDLVGGYVLNFVMWLTGLPFGF